MSEYLYGIDVSGWNKVVDYDLVAQNVDFAYLKASEGKTNATKLYSTHRDNLESRGVPTGPFHYAWLVKHGINEPVQQAKWFCKQVGRLGADSFLPCLDVESGWYQPKAKIIWWVNQWIDVVENELGAMVCVYTYRNYWRYKLGDEGVWDRPLWLANYVAIKDNRPKLLEPKKIIKPWDYTMWQYTHKGVIPGINGKVDMNRLHRQDLTTMMVENVAA